jgi:hypothetical protein
VSSSPGTPGGATSSTPNAAGGVTRIDVCHFDADTGGWSKISVPEQAVQAHLAQHNDALPGSTTPDGTALDASCSPLGCPCYDTASLVALFQPGEPARDLTCGFGFGATWIHDLDAAREPKYIVESWLKTSNGSDAYECYRDTMPPGSDPAAVRRTISLQQHRACIDVIGAAQIALGCRVP